MKRFGVLTLDPRRLVRVLTIYLSTLLISYGVGAHTLPISELKLVADEGYLHLDLTLNPFELTFFSELDANHNGRLDVAEWEGQGEKIAWRILENLKLRVDNRLLVADIAGLVQSYESHHITVRAHFAVDARQVKLSVESHLGELTSGSHVTQVTFIAGNQIQAARLDMQVNKATFEPVEASRAITSGSMTVRTGSDFTALQANETAVMALLSLLFLAALPPAAFLVLSTRFAMNHRELPHTPIP